MIILHKRGGNVTKKPMYICMYIYFEYIVKKVYNALMFMLLLLGVEFWGCGL